MDHKEQIHEVRSHSHHNGGGHHRSRGPPPPHSAHGYDYAEEYISPQLSRDDALRKVKTAGSVSISPELFEKLYLSPQNNVKGDLRKTFGNPTPMYAYNTSHIVCLLGRKVWLTPG